MSKLLPVVVLVMAWAGVCHGHSFNPSLLELREGKGGRVEVLWKDTESPGGRTLLPELPCPDAAPPIAADLGSGRVLRRTLQCGRDGLRGTRVAVRGFAMFGEEALLRVELSDGRTLSAVLRPDAPELTIPARGGAVLKSYVGLGVLHILTGYDHLLFVLALLLLVRGVRRLLWTLTAFTVAHSVTLSLATLGLVRVPAPPVEAAIALSIVFLAAELCRQGPGPTWTTERPWIVAFAFGLLHGLGFAGALSEVGLPAGEIPLALLGFNLGVEAGQVLFVAGVLLLRGLLSRVRGALLPWPRFALAYGIGTLAAFWCCERVAAFWGR